MIDNTEIEIFNRSQNLKNYNEALTTSWELVFNKFPDLIYFAQSVTIPSVTVDGIKTSFQNQRMYLPDNQIDYGQLNISFIVDEDFENYDAILEEFKRQETAGKGNGNKIREILHDLTVIRYSSNKVPIAVFKFTDASLTNLGSINYTSTGAEAEIIICDVSFNVSQMYIQRFRKSNILDGTIECKV
jgi:hypothetical protein